MFKRIIFALLFKDSNFYLSRNFRLQKVGDINWLKNNFSFNESLNTIDELVILNVNRENCKKNMNNFIQMVNDLRKTIFIPITIGGGINSSSDAKLYFENGADKISISSNFNDVELIKSISKEYGSQSISLILDYKKIKKRNIIFINNGLKESKNLNDFLKMKKLQSFVGDIIFNSIDNDGSGSGLDLKLINILNKINNPILLMGGAGKPEHFDLALKNSKISGVVTANLFNFLGNGLKITRDILFKNKIKIAKFK